MTKDQIMNWLHSYCELRSVSGLQALLKRYKDEIDLSYQDGKVFNHVIDWGYVDILNVLLDFYKQTKLQDPEYSQQYKDAYCLLQDMLEDAANKCLPSEEIQAILDPYLREEDEGSSHSDDQKSVDIPPAETTPYCRFLPLTSENIALLEQEYYFLNIEALKSYSKNERGEAIKITEAARLVVQNRNTTIHAEHKTLVIYNYLKFTNDNWDDIVSKIGHIKNFLLYTKRAAHIAMKDCNQKVIDHIIALRDELKSANNIDHFTKSDLRHLSSLIEELSLVEMHYHHKAEEKEKVDLAGAGSALEDL